VFFTGPTGFGFDEHFERPERVFAIGCCRSVFLSQNKPARLRAWAAPTRSAIKDTVTTFTAPDPQVSTHLIVPVPKITLSNGQVASASWRLL
jgi:hypothetical protein